MLNGVSDFSRTVYDGAYNLASCVGREKTIAHCFERVFPGIDVTKWIVISTASVAVAALIVYQINECFTRARMRDWDLEPKLEQTGSDDVEVKAITLLDEFPTVGDGPSLSSCTGIPNEIFCRIFDDCSPNDLCRYAQTSKTAYNQVMVNQGSLNRFYLVQGLNNGLPELCRASQGKEACSSQDALFLPCVLAKISPTAWGLLRQTWGEKDAPSWVVGESKEFCQYSDEETTLPVDLLQEVVSALARARALGFDGLRESWYFPLKLDCQQRGATQAPSAFEEFIKAPDGESFDNSEQDPLVYLVQKYLLEKEVEHSLDQLQTLRLLVSLVRGDWDQESADDLVAQLDAAATADRLSPEHAFVAKAYVLIQLGKFEEATELILRHKDYPRSHICISILSAQRRDECSKALVDRCLARIVEEVLPTADNGLLSCESLRCCSLPDNLMDKIADELFARVKAGKLQLYACFQGPLPLEYFRTQAGGEKLAAFVNWFLGFAPDSSRSEEDPYAHRDLQELLLRLPSSFWREDLTRTREIYKRASCYFHELPELRRAALRLLILDALTPRSERESFVERVETLFSRENVSVTLQDS